MVQVKASIGKERYKTLVRSENKEILADEPLDSGGADLGFSPSELLAGALASCTAITLRMYADRKNWDMDEVNVNVQFERDASKNISQFIRNIQIRGNIDDEQKSRLLTIANACPIHKTLSGTININTEIE